MQFTEREIMNRIKRINLQFIIEMKRLSQLSPAVVKANTGCDDRTIQLMKDIKEENIMKLAEEDNDRMDAVHTADAVHRVHGNDAVIRTRF